MTGIKIASTARSYSKNGTRHPKTKLYTHHLELDKALDKNNSLYIIGESDNRFRIITNLNEKYPSDFSVILAVIDPKGIVFRIRRYNGMHKRPHINTIEKQKIYGYHIHFATERYQERGYDEEAYAEKTDRYNNLKGALNCLIQDANFELPAQLELRLF